MKIVVDGFPLRVRSAGIGRYTTELLRHCTRLGREHEWYISDLHVPFLQSPAGPVPPDGDFDGFVRRQVGRTPLAWKVTPFVVRQALVRRHVKALGAGLFFGPNYFGVFDDSFRTVITVHDLVYQRFPQDTDPFMLRHLTRALERDAGRAAAILADSEATRRDVIELLGVPAAKVHTVLCGVGEAFRPADDPAVRERARRLYGLPERFLLFVGTVEPRKNLVRLVTAFDALAAAPSFRHGLVIVGGKGWKDRAIRAALGESRAVSRIVLTGHVPGADLPVLYSLADALVIPSLYEGFGLPVLEAMACGTAVVTSNVSSLPEVAGGAAVLVDPTSAEDIARGMRSAIEDDSLREDLRRRGLARAKEFTWERAARRCLDIFAGLAAP
jgi:glycosyltransferase involved in cell wall biosynthesis